MLLPQLDDGHRQESPQVTHDTVNAHPEDVNPAASQPGDVDLAPVGTLASYAFSQTDAGRTPVGGLVGDAGKAALSGASPSDVAKTTGRSALAEGVRQVVDKVAPGVPGLAPLGATVAVEATRENPNYAAAGIRSVLGTLSSMIGAAINPAFGPLLTNAATGQLVDRSLTEGYLGDLADSRQYESMRDNAEDQGYSVGQTSDMAERERQSTKEPGFEPGVSDKYGYSVSPSLSDAQSALSDRARESFSDYMGSGNGDGMDSSGPDSDGVGAGGNGDDAEGNDDGYGGR
jgi:hypothetical protein